MARRVLAVAAHPDDVEFLMAGTLLRLKTAGYAVHILNIASGSCGSSVLSRDEIVEIRWREARASAAEMGAVLHPALVDDIAILYEPALLARVAAIVRDVSPAIVLTHSPCDYMEDHETTSRLAVTALFCRGMPNFPTDPPVPAIDVEAALYHAQPFGNRDPFGQMLTPSIFVDITPLMGQKRAALLCHQSQKRWLDKSQGLDSYIKAMEDIGEELGGASGHYRFAEGWRQRFHQGLSRRGFDPLSDALPGCVCRPPA